MLRVPHQIGQAIEEVNSNNQELLRKYRRELQLRKKCHNELVRLKGDCGRPGGGCRHRGPLPGSGVILLLPTAPSTAPWSSALSRRSCCLSIFEDKATETQSSQGLDLSSPEALASVHSRPPAGLGGEGLERHLF